MSTATIDSGTGVMDLSPDTEAVNLEQLHPHPRNPRGKLKPADVADLAQSIARYGLLQPLIVTPRRDGGYTVLAGHRRLAALQVAGKDEALIRVLHGAEAEHLEVMLVENQQRVDVDPLAESELVNQLIETRGLSIRDVADALGKPVGWVARRANLRTLSPEVRKLMAGGKDRWASWTPAMLEDLARLSPAAQEELAGERWIHDHEQLRREVADRLHVLGQAPWDLTDATLVPKAGSCETCPKHSLHAPGLFDEDLDAKDVRKATCRDDLCWMGKVMAHVRARVAAAREEHPNAILVMSREHDDDRDVPKEFSGNLVSSWDVAPAKKGAAGAVPAITVNGAGAGTVRWVKPKQYASSSAKKALKQAKAKRPEGPTLAQRQARLRDRRRAAYVDLVSTRLPKEPPSISVLRGLVLAYGCESPGQYGARLSANELERLSSLAEGPARDELWKRVRPLLARSLQRFGAADRVEPWHRVATWLADVLELDGLETEVEKQVPTPKSLLVATKSKAKRQTRKKK